MYDPRSFCYYLSSGGKALKIGFSGQLVEPTEIRRLLLTGRVSTNHFLEPTSKPAKTKTKAIG